MSEQFVQREDDLIWKRDINKRLEVLSVFSTGPFTYEKESRTINIDSSMTADEINEKINDIGKFIPYGVTITIQFADGTYVLDDSIYFKGFIVLGNLNIYGNTSETNATDRHTTQQVITDFSSSSINGFSFKSSLLRGSLRNINIKIKTDAAFRSGVNFEDCRGNYNLYYNYINGNSTTYGFGASVNFGNIHVRTYKNYISNVYAGLIAQWGGGISSWLDDDTGTMPKYGRIARYGGLGFSIGTLINGSSADTSGDGIIS